jgi:hypothetical protein
VEIKVWFSSWFVVDAYGLRPELSIDLTYEPHKWSTKQVIKLRILISSPTPARLPVLSHIPTLYEAVHADIVGEKVDTAQSLIGALQPPSGAVSAVTSASEHIQGVPDIVEDNYGIWSPLLERVKIVVDVVDKIAEVLSSETCVRLDPSSLV